MQENWVRSLGWEDPLEEGMATHSSMLAQRIPMDRGAWWATIHGVSKSRTRLSDFTYSLLSSSFPSKAALLEAWWGKYLECEEPIQSDFATPCDQKWVEGEKSPWLE